jgi:hypothetical protein
MSKLRTSARLSIVAAVFALFAPARASAEETAPGTLTASAKAEARQRFSRGLTLYNDGDLSGALAEFQQVYKLSAHPVVLYNLALVLAGLGRSAEAVDALEKLQDASLQSALGAERAARAARVLEEQRLRVGTLEVRTNVPRTQIQLDSLDVARTPAAPLRVTAGTHVISLAAPEHEPRRLSVTVAGKAKEVLEVELTPLEAALAHFTPESPVPDVEVRANGELLGTTPFATDLAFRPGAYELEFTRPGYVPVRRQVQLDPGSHGRLEVAMVPSDAGLAHGGLVKVALSERDAVVAVDGQPRLDHVQGLRLPVGRHHLLFQRAGFFDVAREVWVKPGPQQLGVALLPTPEYLDTYVRSAKTRRTWGLIALGGGALVAGSSAAFLLWNQGQKRDAKREFDAYASEVEASPTGRCMSDECVQKLGILVDELDARRGRDVFGWIGVGVGAAALGTGALLWASAADPDRYTPKPESDVFGQLELSLTPRGVNLRGNF